MGTVSCIVSAYYAEEFLAGRLQNLVEQSTQPEIIVVCRRGSKEYSIASAWENSKSLIRVIETDDIPTIYAAWNLGIQAATSGWRAGSKNYCMAAFSAPGRCGENRYTRNTATSMAKCARQAIMNSGCGLQKRVRNFSTYAR